MLLGWRSDSGVDTLPNMGVTWIPSEIDWDREEKRLERRKGGKACTCASLY